MIVYRYIWRGVDLNDLKRSVEDGILINAHNSAIFVDISVSDVDKKPDLDYEMDRLGYDFYSTSPVDKPPICLSSPNGNLFKLEVTNLGLLNIILI